MDGFLDAIFARRREATAPECDPTIQTCAVAKSHPGDVDDYRPPAPKVDAAKNAEVARNMAAAESPKLDELSWRALRQRIASLEASKSDPAELEACKRELVRRQAYAKPGDDQPVSHWGAYAEGHTDGKKLLATGKVALATNSHRDVELGTLGGTIGTTVEVNGAALRATRKTTAAGTTTVEAGSGKLSAGFANADGSIGFHVAGQANVVSVEHTEQTKEGASATGGLSVGPGFEVSFGVKGEGMCVRLGAGPLTVGGCTAAAGTAASWGDDGSKR